MRSAGALPVGVLACLLAVVMTLPAGSLVAHAPSGPTELGPSPTPRAAGPVAVPSFASTPSVGIRGGIPPAETPSPGGAAVLRGESTLTLYNGTLWAGTNSTLDASQPSYDVFDPKSDEVFVTSFYEAAVAVIDPATEEVVDLVPAPIYPNSIAYDPVNGEVYVGLQTYDSVEVIDGQTNSVVGNVSVGLEPFYLQADPVSGNVFLIGENGTGAMNIAVINGTTGAVQTEFPLGPGWFPEGMDYDPANGEFYISSINIGAPGGSRGNLTEVNASKPAEVGNISLTFNPASIVYVPSIQSFYVANASGNAIAVLDPGSGTVTSTITGINTPGLLTYASDGDVYVGTFPNTITVIDSHSGLVLTNLSDDRGPDGFAFDSKNGDLYATDYVWANVTVWNTSTDTLVATIDLADEPYATTYDPTDGDLYVLDLLDQAIDIVNGSTGRVLGSIPYGYTAIDIAYDPVTNEIYGTDPVGGAGLTGNISIVNLTLGRVTGFLPSGSYPWGIASDPRTGDLFVANANSNNVSVLDPVADTVVTSVAASTEPLDVAYDPTENYMVVTDFYASNVTVINASSDALVGTVTVGQYAYSGTWGVAADDPSGNIFVTNWAVANVSVIGGTNLTEFDNFRVGGEPKSADYDPLDNTVYVSNSYTDNLTLINATTDRIEANLPSGAGPVPVLYDPADGAMTVGNFGSGSLTWLPPSEPVTFTESGLPGAANWTVEVNGTAYATNASAQTLYFPNGTMIGYAIGPVPGYAATPSSGRLTVVAGLKAIAIAFAAPREVTFVEFDLPAGTTWNVTFDGMQNGSTGSEIGFRVASGTGYLYSVDLVPGFVPSPEYGEVNVSTVNVSVLIDFEMTFPVTFTESGLEAPFAWTIDFDGVANHSGTPSIGFAATNGTGLLYSVLPVPGYTAHPSHGSVPVAGDPAAVAIVFVPVFAVTFNETGLPAGVTWGITFNGSSNTSTTGSIVYFVPNGTNYAYLVSATDLSYLATPASGTVNVTGAPVAVGIAFALKSSVLYEITFTEVGLPAGTTWSVTLLGPPTLQRSGTGATLVFNETDGSYPFSVTPVSGYNITPLLGTVPVDGKDVAQPINFTIAQSTQPGNNSASPATSPLALYVIVGAVALIAIVGVLAYVWTRRGGRKGPTVDDGERPANEPYSDDPAS